MRLPMDLQDSKKCHKAVARTCPQDRVVDDEMNRNRRTSSLSSASQSVLTPTSVNGTYRTVHS